MKQRGLGCHYGFTLLEVMFTVILLIVGVIGIIQAMASGTTNDRIVEYRAVALTLAQEKLESLKGGAYEQIISKSNSRVSMDTDDEFYSYYRQVDVAAGDPKHVTVTVARAYKDQTISVSLETLFADL